MHKKAFPTGFFVAVAAASAMTTTVLPAKAACLSSTGTAGTAGYNPCVTFDPASSSSVTGYKAFTGSGNVSATYSKVKVRFRVNASGATFPVSPFNGISLTGQGITTSLSIPGSVSVLATGTWYDTPYVPLNSTVLGSGLSFAQNTLSFTFPAIAGISSGNTVNALIMYSDDDEINQNGATGMFISSAVTQPATGTPGPLPILGAAFAFSRARKLRRVVAAAS